jgi:hypothetical protein
MKQILLLIILSSVFFSCRKDVDPCDFGPNSYNYLSSDNKAKIPYNGDELLMFTSNFGDTAICIGQGREQFFTTYTWYDYGCERQMFSNYEAFKIKFLDENKKLNIEIIAYFYDEQMKFGTILYKISGTSATTYTGYLDTTIPKWETYIVHLTSKEYRTIPFINLQRNSDTIFVNIKKGIISFNVNDIKWKLYED